MDPNACLDRAQDAFDNGDHREARAALRDYADWRKRGGFEPEDGDAAATSLAEDLGIRLGLPV